jgi:putative endonuclease
VLGLRVRTPAGELDVVARRGSVLLAVEVKSARSASPQRYRPGDRHGPRRRRRQARALSWLAAHLRHRGATCCGLAEVFAPPGGRPRVLLHLAAGGTAHGTGFHPRAGDGR